MSYDILLVDDSVTVRAVIKKALQMAEVPYRTIYQAGNGEEALSVLSRHAIDLVISDIVMPHMDGEQLVAAMSELGLIETTPVIVVSSAGSEMRLRRLEELGVHGFIQKPFTPEQIREQVDEAMGARNA